MLQYKRIDISEGIDPNKSDKLKECMICCYWYFKDFKHLKSMMVYDLNDFMVLNIKRIDFRSYVFNMTKNDAITLDGF